MKTLGEKIREQREFLRMTQDELAEKVGLSSNTIINYEKNKRVPMSDSLSLIARALKTKVSYLLGEDDVPVNVKEETINGGKVRGEKQLLMIPRISSEYRVSAGTGNAYESIELDVIGKYPLFDGPLSAIYDEDALTCISVEGDSMEPQIHDGDIVIFNHNPDWVPGNIYVVCLEGKMLVKGLIDDGRGNPPILRSSNKEYYGDIKVRDDQFFLIYGRVVKIITERGPKPII